MRYYSHFALATVLLQACAAGTFAANAEAGINSQQFVSLSQQQVARGIQLSRPGQTGSAVASHEDNLLYIDADGRSGWFNERKLTGNRDFTVRNGEVLVSKALFSELLAKPQAKADEAKKVYALYHGFRRTRLHDGDLGTWKIFYKTEASKTGIKYINYNADLLDKDGHHEVAASNGVPIVGMQSDRDPDNIEYKILLAKTALVDGFIVDYVFPEHSNTVLIKDFINVAKKYDFEIGVDWLDASVFSNWVQNYPGYEHIKTREQKTEYAKYALRYAWENFYTAPTAANFKNRPLYFIFGGATQEELKNIISANTQVNDALNPIYIRRSQLWGKATGGEVAWDDLKTYYPRWHGIGVDIFSWKATCTRPTDGQPEYAAWDKYASWQDNFDFARQYAQMWQDKQKVSVNTACVWPGFDNKGCAEWGKGTFSVIDRKDGSLYRSLWDYYLQHKDLLDIVFIASWSDFTEGHEIEPTVKNGYREVLSTLEFANKFKDNRYNHGPEPIYYPEKIFRLRKLARKYQNIGLKTDADQQLLDAAAFAVSRRYYQSADKILQQAEKRLADAGKKVEITKLQLRLENNDFQIVAANADTGQGSGELSGAFNIVLSEKALSLLRGHFYEGVLNFSYYGDNHEKFRITSDTKKAPPLKLGLTQHDYGVVADITKNNSNQWEACKVALYAENIKFAPGQSKAGHLRFAGNARFKDISIDVTYYQLKN